MRWEVEHRVDRSRTEWRSIATISVNAMGLHAPPLHLGSL